MNISEKLFKKRVMSFLLKRNITTIDLRSGTFDLFLDEGNRCFLELKIANPNYKFRAKELGINLGPQTKALRIMKNMPIVLACNHRNMNECFVAFPKELKKLVEVRKGYPKVAIGIRNLKILSFENAIKKIAKHLTVRAKV